MLAAATAARSQTSEVVKMLVGSGGFHMFTLEVGSCLTRGRRGAICGVSRHALRKSSLPSVTQLYLAWSMNRT